MAKELITLNETIAVINELFNWDAEKHGKNLYTLKTLYNMISYGELHKKGPHRPVLLEKEEVIKVFKAKRKVG